MRQQTKTKHEDNKHLQKINSKTKKEKALHKQTALDKAANNIK